MKIYDDETLKQINESVDLFEYANHTLQFEKKGKDYFTNCPLHTDNTPSLSFTPAKNSYYCFSCGCRATRRRSDPLFYISLQEWCNVRGFYGDLCFRDSP